MGFSERDYEFMRDHRCPPERYWYEIDRTRQYEGGEIAVKVARFGKGHGGGFAWVTMPDGRQCFCEDRIWFHRCRQRARLFAELVSQVGIFQQSFDPEFVPTSIAVLQKPAIAAYLCAVCNLLNEEIADRMGVKESTVAQYLSHFQEGRR